VGDAKLFQRQLQPLPAIYMPHSQQLLLHQGRFAYRRTRMTFIVRTNSENHTGLLAAAKSLVAEVDPSVPVFNPRTLESYLDLVAQTPRYYMLLLTIFGVVAIVLAAVGIYGLIAYSVVQRTHEIGVRRALGASTQSVLRMVVFQGLWLVCSGLVLGLAASAGLTRLLFGLLWGIEPTDPPTFAAITVLLIFAGLIACIVPSLRAARIDPLTALRHE
jgi:putative ABC transport system permease protein